MRRMTESFPRCNGGRGMTESSCTTDVTTLSEVPHLQLTHTHISTVQAAYSQGSRWHPPRELLWPMWHWSAELASSQLAVQSQ